MSKVEQHTQILIKDLDFQAKYHLSHTQTDLMAYMVNVTHWATSVNGYYVIATAKVLSDLPHLGEKTFEASLQVLKEFGLVQCKIVEVKNWKGKPKLRGLRLTKKGQEYNARFFLPTNENKLEKENQTLKDRNQILEEMVEKLTTIIEEKEEKTTPKKEEPTPAEPNFEIEKEEIDNFIQKITQHFGRNSKPICNLAPQYNKNTTFYINSYNRLSVLTPQNEFKQLSNPKFINDFWEWLFLNPQRIGNKIDFSKAPTLKNLKERFINRTIKIKGNKSTIIDFIETQNGVKMKIRTKDGTELSVLDTETKKDKIFELEDCQRIILKILS